VPDFERRPGRARHEISMPMGLQAFHIKVQTGLRLIMIRENLVGQKTRNRYQVIGKKARRQNRESQGTDARCDAEAYRSREVADH
jgi:hypothetical protein